MDKVTDACDQYYRSHAAACRLVTAAGVDELVDDHSRITCRPCVQTGSQTSPIGRETTAVATLHDKQDAGLSARQPRTLTTLGLTHSLALSTAPRLSWQRAPAVAGGRAMTSR